MQTVLKSNMILPFYNKKDTREKCSPKPQFGEEGRLSAETYTYLIHQSETGQL